MSTDNFWAEREALKIKTAELTAKMSDAERAAYNLGIRQAMDLLDAGQAEAIGVKPFRAQDFMVLNKVRSKLGLMEGDPVQEEVPYDMRLKVAAEVFKAIVEHAKEGGSYRHLIYGRLGFHEDAYVPLYEAGGMTISNEFNLGGDDDR